MIKLQTIKPNPDNPRVVKDEAFKKLVKSISEFPKMMALRPMVIDENNIVLGGNMRLRALQELGYEEIPADWVRSAADLTEEEKRRFIVADNVSFGEWDIEALKGEGWDVGDLEEWGLDGDLFTIEQEADVDYSALDDEDVSDKVASMESGTKKALMIEFTLDEYPDAYETMKKARDADINIGREMVKHLKTLLKEPVNG